MQDTCIKLVIQQNAWENVCQMGAILPRPQSANQKLTLVTIDG